MSEFIHRSRFSRNGAIPREWYDVGTLTCGIEGKEWLGNLTIVPEAVKKRLATSRDILVVDVRNAKDSYSRPDTEQDTQLTIAQIAVDLLRMQQFIKVGAIRIDTLTRYLGGVTDTQMAKAAKLIGASIFQGEPEKYVVLMPISQLLQKRTTRRIEKVLDFTTRRLRRDFGINFKTEDSNSTE